MTYNATYDQNDTTAIIFDGIGTAGIAVIGFLSLIVVLAVLVWAKHKLTKR